MERDGQIVNVREKGELNHLYDADGSPVQIVTMGGGVGEGLTIDVENID